MKRFSKAKAGRKQVGFPRSPWPGNPGISSRPVVAGLMILACHAGLADTITASSHSRPELELGRNELHDYDPPEPGSYELPVLKEAKDGRVLDSKSNLVSLKQLLDKRITVLSFVYLRCGSANACPYATGVLRQVHQITAKDPALASEMQLVTLSFDPENDTPQRMGAFGELFRAKGGCDWQFLTTRGQADLEPLLKAYDQTVDRKANMNDPLGPYYHPVRVYLIDSERRIRNIYSFGMLDPRMIITDIRTLKREAQEADARVALE